MEKKKNTPADFNRKIEIFLDAYRRGFRHEMTSAAELLEEIGIYHQELEYQNEELKRITLELDTSRQHFTDLFNDAPVGYVTYDDNLRIHTVNNTFASMTGNGRVNMKHTFVTDWIHPGSQDAFYFHIQALRQTGKTQSVMLLIPGKDQNHFVKVSTNTWQTEPELLYRSAITDITHEKQVEQELVQAKEKAEESDRFKSAFLANMSHEIRTPMNAIVGFADLLHQEDLGKAERIKYSAVIIRRSEDLLGIINDLLDISIIESNQIRLDNKIFLAGEVLEEVFQSYQTILKHNQLKQVTLVREIDPEAFNLHLNADETRLRQVLNNLLNNALKFTKEGTVTLGCTRKDEQNLLFFVRDTGIGIDPVFHEVIFERFRQGADEIHGHFGGTGLGLSICKGLIELMNGKIMVESVPGQGSTFTFTLPLYL